MIFRVSDQKELLTIKVEQDGATLCSANACEFTKDGKAILSAWTDGKVRAFTPQSGRLIWIIKDCHS